MKSCERRTYEKGGERCCEGGRGKFTNDAPQLDTFSVC